MVETALIGVLFSAGLVMGITSVLTLWVAERAGLKNYMLKPIIVAGFIFTISEAILAASPFLPDFALEIHFLLEALALSAVVFGVIKYYQNIVAALHSE